MTKVVGLLGFATLWLVSSWTIARMQHDSGRIYPYDDLIWPPWTNCVDPSYMILNLVHIFDNISWDGHPWSIIDYCIIYYCLSGTRISDNCYIWSQSCCCRWSKRSCWVILGHLRSLEFLEVELTDLKSIRKSIHFVSLHMTRQNRKSPRHK